MSEHTTDKAREQRLRRLATREGYVLRKSRKVNFHPDEQGGYAIIDPATNFICYGWQWELDLDDVEHWLTTTGDEEES